MGFHLWLYEYLLKYLININPTQQSTNPTLIPPTSNLSKKILPIYFPSEFDQQSTTFQETLLQDLWPKD